MFYSWKTPAKELCQLSLIDETEHEKKTLLLADTVNIQLLLSLVGEPINEEAWHWYKDVVGDGRCPIVDSWWQTGI